MLQLIMRNKKKSIFLLLAILLFIFWSMNMKNISSQNTTISVPIQYQKIINDMDINNASELYKTKKFIKNNPNIYGALTSMYLSQKYIIGNKLDQAIVELNNTLKYTMEENLQNLIKIKIAKIKIEKKEYNDALNILNTFHDHNWDNIVTHIKGDIFFKQNHLKKAILFWKKSLLLEESDISKKILNMKINRICSSMK